MDPPSLRSAHRTCAWRSPSVWAGQTASLARRRDSTGLSPSVGPIPTRPRDLSGGATGLPSRPGRWQRTRGYNAANEVCVRAFLGHQLSWLGIVDTVARVVADLGDPAAGTLEDVLAADTGRERDRTNSSPETGATRAPLNIQTMFAPTGAHRGALATAQTHRTVRGAAVVVHQARGASPTTCVPKLV